MLLIICFVKPTARQLRSSNETPHAAPEGNIAPCRVPSDRLAKRATNKSALSCHGACEIFFLAIRCFDYLSHLFDMVKLSTGLPHTYVPLFLVTGVLSTTNARAASVTYGEHR